MLLFAIILPLIFSTNTGCSLWSWSFNEWAPREWVVPSSGSQQSSAVSELSQAYKAPRSKSYRTSCSAYPAKSTGTLFGKDQNCRWVCKQHLDTNHLQKCRRKGLTGTPREGNTKLGSPTFEFPTLQGIRSRKGSGLSGKGIPIRRWIWWNELAGTDYGCRSISWSGIIDMGCQNIAVRGKWQQ